MQKQQEIQAKLEQQQIGVTVDETSDILGRYVVNVLMQPLDAFRGPTSCQVLLVNTEFLQQVDNSTMAQVVIRLLANMSVGFNDVLAFVSDDVRRPM